MPLFLTGPRAAGKSTALRRAIAESSLRARGLRTCFDAPRDAQEKNLWLLPWDEEEDFAPVLCARVGPGRRVAFPEAFDGAGVRLLASASEDPETDLIVIDELGFLEADAAAFRSFVLSLLAGRKPVAGIVRQGLGVWDRAPLGELWNMTDSDREIMPARLAARLRKIASISRET